MPWDPPTTGAAGEDWLGLPAEAAGDLNPDEQMKTDYTWLYSSCGYILNFTKHTVPVRLLDLKYYASSR